MQTTSLFYCNKYFFISLINFNLLKCLWSVSYIAIFIKLNSITPDQVIQHLRILIRLHGIQVVCSCKKIYIRHMLFLQKQPNNKSFGIRKITIIIPYIYSIFHTIYTFKSALYLSQLACMHKHTLKRQTIIL